MPEWISVLREFGFPVVVALILLFRFERAINALTKAVYRSCEENKIALRELGEIIRYDKGISPGPVHLHRRNTDTKEPPKNGDDNAT